MKIAFRSLAIAVLISAASTNLVAHDDHSHEPAAKITVDSLRKKIFAIHSRRTKSELASANIEACFQPFNNVSTRRNEEILFVESNGLPDHDMMVGIRSWQQQVPISQPFTGSNAWRIPLKPKLADQPISAKSNLFRGAIALAVNGVPIFNALNNRGDDALLAGELDQWGGHCGRGDDYHYHIAPVHLEAIVGKGNPIAFALDGFPIFGLTEADGSPVGDLDEFNGQFDEAGNYHYHATLTYPYINGGMRGEVTVRNGQIEPQPRDSPVRPPFEPLRGATITSFQTVDSQSILKYSLHGKEGSVSYSLLEDGRYEFTYREPNGTTTNNIYQRRVQNDRGPSKIGGISLSPWQWLAVIVVTIAIGGTVYFRSSKPKR